VKRTPAMLDAARDACWRALAAEDATDGERSAGAARKREARR
jgi:hypothetical protein